MNGKNSIQRWSALAVLLVMILTIGQVQAQAVTDEQQAKLNQIDAYIEQCRDGAEYHYATELARLQAQEGEDERLLRVLDAGFLNVSTPEELTDYIRAALDLRGVNLDNDSDFSQALSDLRSSSFNSLHNGIIGDPFISSGAGPFFGSGGSGKFSRGGDIETPVNIQRLGNIDSRRLLRSNQSAGIGRASLNQRGIKLTNGAFKPVSFRDFLLFSRDNGNNFDNVAVVPDFGNFNGFGGFGTSAFWGGTSPFGRFNAEQINPVQRLLAVARTRYAQEENRTLRGFSTARLRIERARDYALNVELPELRDKLRNDVLNPPKPAANGVITGIVYSDDKAAAVVGTKVVYTGDSLGAIKVVKIDNETVEFEKNGKTWIQKVGETPSSLQWQ